MHHLVQGQGPSTAPTSAPTDPTSEPTPEPTTEPTQEPTTHPTSDPTVDPTNSPSAAPTDFPSTQDPFDPRRLQFDTTSSFVTTPSPTEVTLPPTPIDTLYISDTDPYILVDFKNPVSWNYANQYCIDRLNSTLASVWRNETTRLSEMEQIKLMAFLCKGNGSTQYPGAYEGGQASWCWIGLRYYQSGSEFFRWISNGQFLDDDSETFWQPGTDPPTAYFFQAYNEDTVWIMYCGLLCCSTILCLRGILRKQLNVSLTTRHVC